MISFIRLYKSIKTILYETKTKEWNLPFNWNVPFFFFFFFAGPTLRFHFQLKWDNFWHWLNTQSLSTHLREVKHFSKMIIVFPWMKSESESHSVMSDSLWPYGLYSPWNSPGHGVGPSPGDLPDPGIEPGSPELKAGSLSTELSGKPPSHE